MTGLFDDEDVKGCILFQKVILKIDIKKITVAV